MSALRMMNTTFGGFQSPLWDAVADEDETGQCL